MKQNNLKTLLLTIGLLLLSAFPTAAQYGSNNFLIADIIGNRIAVYDQNFVFLRYLDTGFNGVTGLCLLANGNVAAVGRSPARLKIYNPAGTVVTDITDIHIGQPIDIKEGPTGLLYVGTQTGFAISEFTATGTYNRSFGNSDDTGVAVFGNTLWASSPFSGNIDVFNLTTGMQTGTIPLDNGQTNAVSMYYSPTTNTILMVQLSNLTVYERTTTGAFVRQFTGGSGASPRGVTRGLNGDVYATASNIVNRWAANGTFISNTDVSANLTTSINIIWTGSIVTAAGVSIGGRVLTQNGAGLRNAIVNLTLANGETRTARTSSFGYYRFDGIEVGQTAVIAVNSKQYQFTPQIISVDDNLADIDFVAITSSLWK